MFPSRSLFATAGTFLGIVLVLGCAAAGRAQPGAESPASAELNLGVSAYKQERYAEAIEHFRRASELAPELTMAKTYLATALAQNVVPGLDTPENMKTAQEAIDEFHQVLAAEPHDINSMKQVAGVYFSTKKLDDARDWQKKVLDENPNDPEAAYTIGVIDWTQAHLNVLRELKTVGLMDDGAGNAAAPPEVLGTIRAENAELVEEALKYLQLAVANRPDYDDAMAYINLVYRRKADLDFDNPRAREEDVATAESWAKRAMLTRKKSEEAKAHEAEQAPQ